MGAVPNPNHPTGALYRCHIGIITFVTLQGQQNTLQKSKAVHMTLCMGSSRV